METLKRKNILYLVHSYRNFQKDQIEVTAKYFNRVYVFVRFKPFLNIPGLARTNLVKQYIDRNRLDLRDLPKNVTVYPINLYYLPFPFFYKRIGVRMYKKVISIVKRENLRFDLIHAHFINTSGYTGALLKKHFGVPLIITSHRNNPNFMKELKYYGKLHTDAIKKADLVIRVNNNSLSKFKEINPNSIYIPNGYNGKLFYPMDRNLCRKELGIENHNLVLLSVGSLDVNKSHKDLVSAISMLKNDISQIRCYIVGAGPLEKTIKKQIENLGLRQEVVLVGYIDSSRLNVWYNSCDIFVLPSKSESFGIVQLEAMACGKPIVATRNGGSEEIVTENTGILVQANNPLELYKGLKNAIEKQWDTKVIIDYANRYSLESISKRILMHYETVLKNCKYGNV